MTAPKLGETIANLYPFLSGIRKSFPEAIIYVCSDFPEPFFAGQFEGKIKPFPRDANDLNDPRWVAKEWGSFTRQSMLGLKKGNFAQRSAFIRAYNIDAVFDISVLPKHFGAIPLQDIRRPLHRFELLAPTALASALDPTLASSLEITADYIDPEGKSHRIDGIDQQFKRLNPNQRFSEAGIWRWSIAFASEIGLNVSPETLETVHPTHAEAAQGLLLLQRWYNEGWTHRPILEPFNFTKRILVVNVYAVTQVNLLSQSLWIDLIVQLLELVQNTYLVFTHGGPMDMGLHFLDQIISEVRRRMPDLGTNIILPRVNLYPYIASIFGISSGLITLDTGTSHLGNGVYGLPMALITTSRILHWMPPRDNITVFMTDIFSLTRSGFTHQVADFAADVHGHFVSPAADAAKKKAAYDIAGRPFHEYLIHQRIAQPDVMHQVLIHLRNYFATLDLHSHFIPTIVFVDSRVGPVLSEPKFRVHLYSTPAKSYLLIDISALSTSSDDPSVVRVKPELRDYEIIREGLARRLVHAVFHFDLVQPSPLARRVNSDEAMQQLEEEVLTRLTFLKIMDTRRRLGFAASEALDYLSPEGAGPDLSTSSGIEHAIETIIQDLIAAYDESDVPSLRFRRAFIPLAFDTEMKNFKKGLAWSFLHEITPFFNEPLSRARQPTGAAA